MIMIITSGAPIMPTDAVSRTANVERNGGKKCVRPLNNRTFFLYIFFPITNLIHGTFCSSEKKIVQTNNLFKNFVHIFFFFWDSYICIHAHKEMQLCFWYKINKVWFYSQFFGWYVMKRQAVWFQIDIEIVKTIWFASIYRIAKQNCTSLYGDDSLDIL